MFHFGFKKFIQWDFITEKKSHYRSFFETENILFTNRHQIPLTRFQLTWFLKKIIITLAEGLLYLYSCTFFIKNHPELKLIKENNTIQPIRQMCIRLLELAAFLSKSKDHAFRIWDVCASGELKAFSFYGSDLSIFIGLLNRLSGLYMYVHICYIPKVCIQYT